MTRASVESGWFRARMTAEDGEGGDEAVAGRRVVEEDHVARLLAAEVVAARAASPRAT